MLELAGGEGEASGLSLPRGLERVGLGRGQLHAVGVAGDEASRLYDLLFVYSIGLHHSLAQTLARLPEDRSAEVAVAWWRTLVAVAERLVRTELRTELLEMLHGMEEEVATAEARAAVEGLEAQQRSSHMQQVLDGERLARRPTTTCHGLPPPFSRCSSSIRSSDPPSPPFPRHPCAQRRCA